MGKKGSTIGVGFKLSLNRIYIGVHRAFQSINTY